MKIVLLQLALGVTRLDASRILTRSGAGNV